MYFTIGFCMIGLIAFFMARSQARFDTCYMFLERNVLLGVISNFFVLSGYILTDQINTLNMIDVLHIYLTSLLFPILVFVFTYRLYKSKYLIMGKYV